MIIVVILLLIPLTAMLFNDEVSWTAGDFLVAGVLLSVTGLACEFVLRKVKQTKYRILFCGILLLSLLLIWLELAVGLFGTPIGGH